MKCARHPDIETNLACGKCGKPICPKCMVQTPVGARCPDCARLYRLPTYQVSAKYYWRGAAAMLGTAIAAGFAWSFIAILIPFFYLNLLVGAGVGYVLSEVVSRAANRKRGIGLGAVAGCGVALSYLVTYLLPWGVSSAHFRSLLDLAGVVLGIIIAVNRLR